jgi:hypothetical protein
MEAGMQVHNGRLYHRAILRRLPSFGLPAHDALL